MENASDELLRQDDVYYTNESKMMKYNMKRNSKKALYESIMISVAKEVKKTLNEDILQDNSRQYMSDSNYDFYVDITRYLMFICDFGLELGQIEINFLILNK